MIENILNFLISPDGYLKVQNVTENWNVFIFLACFRVVIRTTTHYYTLPDEPRVLSDWVHVTLNFIGLNEGDEMTFYLNGELDQRGTTLFRQNNTASTGRIIVGRHYIFTTSYASVYVDELLFFNQSLTQAEVRMLSQLSN